MPRYYKAPWEDVEISRLDFALDANPGFPGLVAVAASAKGPFLADFVWDAESEGWYCDRLQVKRNGRYIRLDDHAVFRPLLDAASLWATDNDREDDDWVAVGEREWEPHDA